MEELNLQLTEHVLKRYLPTELVDRIKMGEFDFAVEPRERLVTILFSDLCGFTKLGEVLSTQDYADQLNEYLTRMNDIIFENYGTVDKFMGDAIMVLFGAPEEMDPFSQAQCALSCSRAMQRSLDELNDAWESRGLPRLQARIGIHQGHAVVGNFGSDRRSDYTCIGRAVNIASRIEGVCDVGSVFVSEILANQLPDEVQLVGQWRAKRRRRPAKICISCKTRMLMAVRPSAFGGAATMTQFDITHQFVEDIGELRLVSGETGS